jgi:hypothetical protein
MRRSSPVKKYTTRSNSDLIQASILAIFMEMDPRLTVRQIYYALTVRGVVPKTENGYRQTCYQLKIMRERGFIPYGWIADNTRYHIKPETDPSLEAALDRWQASYRKDLWVSQRDYVEIWVEKDALAGVISPITEKYDVPLFIARGYSSQTFIYDAAEQIISIGKPTFIYHFGDHDPSGVDAAIKIMIGLWGHGAKVDFEQVAVTEEQIELYSLPVRETKWSDPRSRTWGDKPSVELDALPAPILRGLVKDCIERHIDRDELMRSQLIELAERDTLEAIRRNLVLEQNSSNGGES